MKFNEIIRSAIERNATDLHLEPSLPITYRIRGELQRSQNILSPAVATQVAQEVAGERGWNQLSENGSFDCTKTVAGIVCRINLMKTDKGVGLAIRLLSGQTNTIKTCNLHPGLAELLKNETESRINL